jgi:hypothetical protein
MTLRLRALTLAVLAAVPLGLAGSAKAAPLSAPLGLQSAADPAVQTGPLETVQWRGRGWGGRGWGGRGWGWGPGLAAGAIIGGAVAASQPWNYGYDYGPGYYSYGYDPGYAGGSVAYCEQRFRSYDPASGTYLGYDGLRHPCP